MILSDREIQVLLDRKRILIEPVPNKGAWTSTAVDLLLGNELLVWDAEKLKPNLAMGIDPVFCPGMPGFKVREAITNFTKKIRLDEKPHRIHPREFVLGWTLEKIRLPHDSRVAARVEGKSSLARLGLGVHVTAPTIHAGFGVSADPKQREGMELQLEIWNVGPLPIELRFLMPVCQLIFEEVHGTPLQGYSGQFSTQGPEDPPPK